MIAGRPTERGVSLVELLVALSIGMLVLLGAGRLYLGGVENLARVDDLGERQEAVSLGVMFLLRDIRRGGVDPGRYILVEAASGEGCTLHDSVAGEPLVDGLAATAGSCAASEPLRANVGGRTGLYRITLRPLGISEPLVLHGMDREAAVRHAGEPGP
ncbi:prepilin-type N-terminal cleavage/methylation domain-containing protein [Halomonas sp. I1]|uniref:PilW family protein n=1 Tax=Halomonas sp. I1 TaxID=393536 RepID=UPI0028E01055|nr:prepilin-type N-terminal cleavage/methylation domain-containing protein [Halomonas sp. I1]MDT8894890.1 prepilin-type N-terminal cleavage/methylation domain-containing protein [Halomonas sp. I1]